MSKYRYSLLSQPSNIRLLRLLPCEQDEKTLRCELFEYPIRDFDTASHPYEALSYVWGSEDKPRSIVIDSQELNVTENLYAALSRLRYYTCPRIIWADAVCIDQSNEKEKETQIPLIAEIYSKSHRVVAWLGEAEGDSDQALEAIRLTGEKSAKSLEAKVFQEAIRKLLQRPWFQRIWVLQEMAAARHVLIMCGSTEMDGHAFCLGLDFLGTLIGDLTTQVVFLIRGAIFRRRTVSQKEKRFSLDICSLGELIDMYHAHKATKLHDKVYALLGMCLDDLGKAGLEPDYTVRWEILMKRLVKFLVGEHVSVTTWNKKETAVLRGNGCVLGRVAEVGVNVGLGGGQTLEADFSNASKHFEYRNGNAHWTLPTSAKPIREGDIICLLQGASKPTIVRLCEDHFAVVMIAATPPEYVQIWNSAVRWSELRRSVHFTRDFLLVWDWGTITEEFWDPRKDVFIRESNLLSHVGTGLKRQLSNATRIWNLALILGDLGEYERAKERLRAAINCYKKLFGEGYEHTSEIEYRLTPLCWAAGNGYDVIVDLLIKDNVEKDLRDSEDGRTPLSWAAKNGRKAIVKKLLETGEVNANSKDTYGWTPLQLAAKNGHEAVVKLLLETGEVDADLKDEYRQTPLSLAAQNGHEAIVKLLLETGVVDADSKGGYGQTPLSWAAKNGHEAIVKQLLETGEVDADSKDKKGWRPLSLAAENGHEAVVKLLLETGKVYADSKDKKGWTPLSLAAANGHEAVVKLLLETGEVDVNSKNIYGQTPLSCAAMSGHQGIVKLLLETGEVNIDLKKIWAEPHLDIKT